MYFICVTVQGYYTNCTMEMCQMYKTLNRFVRFLNNLGLTLRRLSIVFFFLPNYVINTFPTKINT